jgi:MFS family permease
VTVAGLLLTGGLDAAVDVALEIEPADETVLTIVVLILAGLALAAALVAFGIVRGVIRRLPFGIGTVIASAVIVACTALMIVGGYAANRAATVGPVVEALAILLTCVLLTGMGGGALISWASRLAVRNASAIGHMASIALPVILMLVVFAFFSGEVWQMASALPWGSLALVGLVIGVLAAIVVLRVSASEIDDDHHAPSAEQRAALLLDTPAEHLAASAGARHPLRWPQRTNILLVMTFAQLLQAVFFAALLCALLVVIGAVAVPLGIVQLWVGPGTDAMPLHVEQLVIGGATLPLTVNLIKAATLLSLIATLPFIFSAVSEPRYRERFFDPIMADLRRAMLVRDALGVTTRL